MHHIHSDKCVHYTVLTIGTYLRQTIQDISYNSINECCNQLFIRGSNSKHFIFHLLKNKRTRTKMDFNNKPKICPVPTDIFPDVNFGTCSYSFNDLAPKIYKTPQTSKIHPLVAGLQIQLVNCLLTISSHSPCLLMQMTSKQDSIIQK